MRRKWVVVGVVTALALAGGGYFAADALDKVPGYFTVRAPRAQAAPYPQLRAPAMSTDILQGLSPDAPVPDKRVVAAGLAKITGAKEAPQVTALVIDALTGDVLAQHKPDMGLAPASSTKVLGAAAALAALGPEYRIATRVIAQQNKLTLVGGGDVLLGAGDNSTDINGRAGLGELAKLTAAKLRERKIQSVELAVDDSAYSGPERLPTLERGALRYVMPMVPLAIDRGRTGRYEYHADPLMHAVNTYRKALEAQGINVTGTPHRALAPEDGEEIARVESAPLGEIARWELQPSDNSVAEAVGRQLAIKRGLPGSYEGSARAVVEQLKEMGFKTEGTVLEDCSGLSENNRVSARLLVDIVRRASVGEGGKPVPENLRPLVAGFPVGGLNGTLKRRMHTLAGGVTRAKTGTLDQSVSLSGTLTTKSGRLLIFSIIVNGFPEGQYGPVRDLIDDYALSLAKL